MAEPLPAGPENTDVQNQAPQAHVDTVATPDETAKGEAAAKEEAARKAKEEADRKTEGDPDKALADDLANTDAPPKDPTPVAARQAETGSMTDAVKEAGKGAREFFGGMLSGLKETVASWIPTQINTALQEIKTDGSLSWMTSFGLKASLIFSKQIPKDSLKDFSDADKNLLAEGCGLQIKDVEKTAGSTVDMVELSFKSDSINKAAVEATRFRTTLKEGLSQRKGSETFADWLTPQLDGKNIGALKAELAKAPDDQKESANALLQVLSKMGATDGDDARAYMTENMNRLLLEFKSVPVVEPVTPPAAPVETTPTTPSSTPTTT